MTPDTVITLGDFEFRDFEVPEEIVGGGDQMLGIQKLIGGARTIDATGGDDQPIEWSGWFIGSDALPRIQTLNSMRVAGQALKLKWSEFNYSVVIRSFKWRFQRYYKFQYSIILEVIEDLSKPVPVVVRAGVDVAVAADQSDANSIVGAVNDSPLTSAMNTLNAAISAVSSFATAAQATISSVLQPLADVRARVAILSASASNTINNVTSLGGVLPNNPVAQSAQNLANQVGAMDRLPQLQNLDATLGRMQANLGTINSSQRTVTVAGGNLYDLAGKTYGNPTAWTTLARANALQDPVIDGVRTLKVPDRTDQSGGVLSA